MCLIAFAWNAHPRWRLLLLGNRDELHARPTAPLARWDGEPPLLAGRDLQAGGTWMGLGADGRVAVVTNVRNPHDDFSGASRGLLVSDYLRDVRGADAHAHQLLPRAAGYRPFNLLLFDTRNAVYLGNRPQSARVEVTDGVHGLSNADFNTPWPKTRALMRHLQAWIDAGGDEGFAPLWTALADDGEWPDDVLPDTGVGIELERRLSAAFIRGERYGTRASTLIAVDREGGARIVERRYGPEGTFLGETGLALPAG